MQHKDKTILITRKYKYIFVLTITIMICMKKIIKGYDSVILTLMILADHSTDVLFLMI